MGKAPGGSVSFAKGFLSEWEILASLLRGGASNCFIADADVGFDLCTRTVSGVTVPWPCVRLTHGVPMAFLEGGDRQGHLALQTFAGQEQMQAVLNAGMSPAEKTMMKKLGDFVSASTITQARTLNMLAVASAIKLIATTISLGNLCTPLFEVTRLPAGYSFASEGDHLNGTEFGNWRGPVAVSWFLPWLTPFNAVARGMEVGGLCTVDTFRIFCHGGLGTVHPVVGSNPVESRQVSFLDSMYDSLTPGTAPFFTYGPLHVRFGTAMHAPAHNFRALATGVTAMHATFSVAGGVQSLYPLREGSCRNVANPAQQAAAAGFMAAALAKTVAEGRNKTADTDRVVAVTLWPRFTCCNWCIGSNEDWQRHFLVGRGFRPQLTP